MDVVTLSRLQFAITSIFHFMFVPLTLGLSVLTAIFEWRYVRTGQEMFKEMARFWGKLFLINFALGIVTGITLEFQFGTNWAEYSKYVGDIFGAPLAIEATAAFFLESVFIGVWIFGWQRVSKRMHAIAITIVAFATNLSAFWILMANGWMQHPVGYHLANGRAEMTDFGAFLTNSYGWCKFGHTLTSGYLLASVFVMGISAYHLLKRNNVQFFTRSSKTAAFFGMFASIAVLVIGDVSASVVAKHQPAKLAAMESVWDTESGAGMRLVLIPDEKNERNSVATANIPRLLSLLAYQNANATVKGLKEFRAEERPPIWPTFYSFRLMVLIGVVLLAGTIVAVVYTSRGVLAQKTWFLKLMLFAIPLPYLANQLGWVVAEVGRQPWIVYGVLKTSEGVSKAVSPEQVAVSLAAFVVIYGLLAVADVYLLTKYSRKGPAPEMK